MNGTSLIPGYSVTLYEQVLRESEAMVRYAVANGIDVPCGLGGQLNSQLTDYLEGRPDDEGFCPDSDEFRELLRIHQRMSRLVAPAKPRSLVELAQEREAGGLLRKFAPVTLIRYAMVVALVCLGLLVGLPLSELVHPESDDILHQYGLPRLMNELFFMAAAGLGASFATLFRASQFIVDGTYDPKYDSLYWSRFLLGVISGLLLVEFIPLDTKASWSAITRPLLAIVGGFSAETVYRLLDRLVKTVGSIVSTDAAQVARAKEKAKSLEAELTDARSRLMTVRELVRLEASLQAEQDPNTLKRAYQKLTKKLIGGDVLDEEEDG